MFFLNPELIHTNECIWIFFFINMPLLKTGC